MNAKLVRLESALIDTIHKSLADHPDLIPTVTGLVKDELHVLVRFGVDALPLPRFVRHMVRDALDEVLDEVDLTPDLTPGTAVAATAPDHDPVTDTRPEAYHLFNPEYVRVTDEDRERIRNRIALIPAASVRGEWRDCEWHSLQEINTVGDLVRVAELEDVRRILPALGTNRIRYSGAEGWVCRNFATLFSAIFTAETTAACAVVMDFSGRHSYNAAPVIDVDGKLRWVVIEPQADEMVAHLDPGDHYVGTKGFAVLT